MSTPDDVLGWIRPPLEELKQNYDADPGKPWEEHRASFLRQLGLQDASQDPVVQELLKRLDEAPEEERNSILGGNELDSLADELARQHAPLQEEAGDKTGYAEAGDKTTYDEQAWQAYLAQNGPQWDGTEESWEQFRQWFAYYASQQRLGAPAAQLLDYLAAQPVTERITTFAQYGVMITPPQEAAAQEPAAAEQGGQEIEQPTAGEVSAGEMDSIAEDALKAHPEVADMSEEEHMRVISEVLDEIEAG